MLLGVLGAASACSDSSPSPESDAAATSTAAPIASGAPAGAGEAAAPGAAATGPPGRPPRAQRDSPLKISRERTPEFLAAAQKQLPQMVLDRRDAEVEEIALAVCDELTAGIRPAEVVAHVQALGIAEKDARTVLDLARSTVCTA